MEGRSEGQNVLGMSERPGVVRFLEDKWGRPEEAKKFGLDVIRRGGHCMKRIGERGRD